jgi:hypothetical protein
MFMFQVVSENFCTAIGKFVLVDIVYLQSAAQRPDVLIEKTDIALLCKEGI